MRRRKRQPWHSDIPARLRFERQARSRHPELTSSTTGRRHGGLVTYQLTVTVPEYESRRVTIELVNGYKPYGAKVTVDGLQDSPHRYDDGSLCIWHPRDPDSQRWVGSDGLAALITHVRIHLFKEAYWRETGEWLGPDAPHQAAKERDPQDDSG
jgi:hypothetical protein